LQHQRLTRDELLLKLSAAKKEAGRAYALLDIHVPEKDQAVTPETFTFSLNRAKLRLTRRREGHYLLRSNLSGEAPAKLRQYYIQLTEVEQAFKELKNELSIRPIFHQKEVRIEAHIFVAFVAYCLQVTLKQRLRALASGPDPAGCTGEILNHLHGRRACAHDR
jgi:transposase